MAFASLLMAAGFWVFISALMLMGAGYEGDKRASRGWAAVVCRFLAGRRLRFLGAAVSQERCQPTPSEGQVLPFPQPLPVGKLIAKSKPAIFGEAEDIEFVIVYELGAILLGEVSLQITEVLRPEVHRALGKLLISWIVVASVHGTSVMRSGEAKNTRNEPSPLKWVQW
jgi:hypothetical protein